jgi:lysozyme family protein
MIAQLVEYAVVRKHGNAWTVLRGGEPIGCRHALDRAVDFATLLAEREALAQRRATRVVVDRVDAALISSVHAWRCAA